MFCSDHEIIEGMLSRDVKYVSLMIDKYNKLILGVIIDVIKRYKVDTNIQDIFSNAVKQIFESSSLYDPRISFTSFIISITKYETINYIKNKYSNVLDRKVIDENELADMMADVDKKDKEIIIRYYCFYDDISTIAKYMKKDEEYIKSVLKIK